MSYKDGIPLLHTFDDGGDSDEEDFTVETSRPSRFRCKRKQLCFGGVILFAVIAILGIVAVVAVPIVITRSQGGSKGVKESQSPLPPVTGTALPQSHTEPPQTHTSPSKSHISPSQTHTAPPETHTAAPATHTAPPETHTAAPQSHTAPSQTHTAAPETHTAAPATHTAPPETHTAAPQSHTAPPATHTAAPATHTAAPATHTAAPQSHTTSASRAPQTSTTLPPSPSPSPAAATTAVPMSPTPTPIPTQSPTLPPPVNNTCDNGVCSGKLDERSYEVVTLSNNSLRVLLVSDPESNLTAAAMDVAVGSFSDPPEVQGLAHFCEHMLFLGTKKYPNEHEYSSFLKTHGGFDNAYTSTQETNYFFAVQADYLEHALDLFAQFFISPLFTESATGREMNAVNSEHEKNLESDTWRLWQLLKHVSNPAHPFSQFSTGTIETLNKSNISEYLWDYYNTSYSANQMQLVVYGKQSLDTLRQWVNNSFSEVPNRGVTTPTFNTTSFPPNSSYSGQLVHYYPVADITQLSIYWQTDPLEKKYRNAVASFLARYIGHEGEGSLLQYFREKDWANALSAGAEFHADSYSLLYVSVDLTSAALPYMSDVVASIFQYLRLLRGLDEGEWQDFLEVVQVNFDYAAKQDPDDYVVALAENMRVVDDPLDFLGNPRRFVFDHSLINHTLCSLSPENAVIFIGSQRFNTSDANSTDPIERNSTAPPFPWPELDSNEPIYSTYYNKLSLSVYTALVSYFNSDLVERPFSLPPPNKFIPRDLDILTPVGEHTVPEVVDGTPQGSSLWWLQDPQFNEPKLDLNCYLNTSNAQYTPRWIALTSLYIGLVELILQPTLYPATELDFSYSLASSNDGLSMSFSGFSDPAVVEGFVRTVAEVLTNETRLMDVRSFNLAKDVLLENYRNYNYTTLPYRYISRYLQNVVMERPYWKNWQVLDELRGIGIDDVIAHATTDLFSNATVLCFAHGNLNQSQAIQYASIVAGAVHLRDDDALGAYRRDRVELTESGNYSFTLQTLNPDDLNSVVNIIFQVDRVCDLPNESMVCSEDSLRTAAHLGILSEIIGEQCFYQLRTIEQLGYVVFCFNTVHEGIGSFQAIVQSVSSSPEYLVERIDSFLDTFRESLAKLNETEFEKLVNVYVATLQRKSLTLSDETERFWSEIAIGQNQFDRRQQLIAVLPSVNATTLLDFYDTYVLDPSSYRKMIIAVHGMDDSDELSGVTYPMDYSQLNQTVSSYP